MEQAWPSLRNEDMKMAVEGTMQVWKKTVSGPRDGWRGGRDMHHHPPRETWEA